MPTNPNNKKKEEKWMITKMKNHQNRTLRSKKNLQKKAANFQKINKIWKNKIQKNLKSKMKKFHTKIAKLRKIKIQIA